MQDLLITWPEGQARFSPKNSPVQVGRSTDAAVILTEPAVSRRHLEFVWLGSSWIANDSSTHGSYDPIGVRLAPTWTVGAEVNIRLGGVAGPELALRVTDHVEPSASAPASPISGSPLQQPAPNPAGPVSQAPAAVLQGPASAPVGRPVGQPRVSDDHELVGNGSAPAAEAPVAAAPPMPDGASLDQRAVEQDPVVEPEPEAVEQFGEPDEVREPVHATAAATPMVADVGAGAGLLFGTPAAEAPPAEVQPGDTPPADVPLADAPTGAKALQVEPQVSMPGAMGDAGGGNRGTMRLSGPDSGTDGSTAGSLDRLAVSADATPPVAPVEPPTLAGNATAPEQPAALDPVALEEVHEPQPSEGDLENPPSIFAAAIDAPAAPDPLSPDPLSAPMLDKAAGIAGMAQQPPMPPAAEAEVEAEVEVSPPTEPESLGSAETAADSPAEPAESIDHQAAIEHQTVQLGTTVPVTDTPPLNGLHAEGNGHVAEPMVEEVRPESVPEVGAPGSLPAEAFLDSPTLTPPTPPPSGTAPVADVGLRPPVPPAAEPATDFAGPSVDVAEHHAPVLPDAPDTPTIDAEPISTPDTPPIYAAPIDTPDAPPIVADPTALVPPDTPEAPPIDADPAPQLLPTEPPMPDTPLVEPRRSPSFPSADHLQDPRVTPPEPDLGGLVGGHPQTAPQTPLEAAPEAHPQIDPSYVDPMMSSPQGETLDRGALVRPSTPPVDGVPQGDGVAPSPAQTIITDNTLRLSVDGKNFTFPPGVEVSVGRDPSSMVHLNERHSLVSRHHLVISFRDGEWWIEDRSSKGTYVDGRKVSGPYRAQGAFVAHLGDDDAGTPMRIITAGEHKPPRSFNYLLVIAAAALVLMTIAGLGYVMLGGRNTETTSTSAETTASAADLVVAKQATVLLIAEEGFGSGFFVTDDLILTNQHVAVLGDSLGVAVSRTTDERARVEYLAETVATHPFLDLAVMRITTDVNGAAVDSSGLTPVSLGDSTSVVLGDKVYSTGFPIDLSPAGQDDMGELLLPAVSTTSGEAANFSIWPGCSNPTQAEFLPVDAPEGVRCAPDGDVTQAVIISTFSSGQGASGSPVFKNDRVVAVVFSGPEGNENAGRNIASSAFADWLADVIAENG